MMLHVSEKMCNQYWGQDTQLQEKYIKGSYDFANLLMYHDQNIAISRGNIDYHDRKNLATNTLVQYCSPGLTDTLLALPEVAFL